MVLSTLKLLASGGQPEPVEVAREALTQPLCSRSRWFVLPEVSKSLAVVLSLEARLDFPRLAGFTYAMKIVNGQPLEQWALLNKPLFFLWKGLPLTWYGTISWAVPYSPDFKATEGYAGLVRLGGNELRVLHIRRIKNPLVLRDVRIKFVKVPSTSRKRASPLRVYEPIPPRRVPYELRVEPEGTMIVALRGEIFKAISQFSYPDKDWNCLGPGGARWRISVKKVGKRIWLIRARGWWHSIRRRVKALREWVEVEDEIVNLSDEDIPVMGRHLILLGEGKVKRALLCGYPIEPSWEVRIRRHFGNLTALAVTDGVALGLPLWMMSSLCTATDMRTFRIARKKAVLPLICQPWKVEMVRQILKRGKCIVANSLPLMETMHRFRFPRFRETASIWNIAGSHLYTPIGLGDQLTIRAEIDEARQVRMNLDLGGLFYFYPIVEETFEKAIAHMFPFMPVDNRSGLFGFGECSKHVVYIYGPDGRRVARPENIEGLAFCTLERGGQTHTELRLPLRFMAVIERVVKRGL